MGIFAERVINTAQTITDCQCGVLWILEKAILVSESGIFLTLGSGTSSTRNKNLRPLFNRNIPLISGKYGLRNHFWPLESRFSHEEKWEKGPNFWGP